MQESHKTTGTRLRDSHALTGQGLKFVLGEEQKELANDVADTSAGRTAKTLAKSDTLRVTLVYLRAGNTVNPGASAGAASLQVLSGRLAIEGDATPAAAQVGVGELVIFSENLREPIRALDDSAFLVTIAWQEGAGAWDQEEQEGRH